MEDKAIQTVKQFYNNESLQEWERLEKEPFEFELTTWMMDRYVMPGDSILDIGGGPGHYSIHYAGKGCRCTLADLSDGNIALAREKAREAGVEIEAYAKNCLELEGLNLGAYDHVFLMGPLYHLQPGGNQLLDGAYEAVHRAAGVFKLVGARDVHRPETAATRQDITIFYIGQNAQSL